MKVYAALEQREDREYYLLQLDDYEDCPDMKDAGSEPSEISLGTAKADGAIDTARHLEFHDATDTKAKKVQGGAAAHDRGGRGGGRTSGENETLRGTVRREPVDMLFWI
jgi:hypothetical protein